jgi:hypothetical protein
MADQRIDSHVHVGLVGNRWPELGGLSSWYRQQLVFRIFLLYAGIDPHDVSDTVLHEATLRTIGTCGLDRVVCLALDQVYDTAGARRPDASHVWVSNDYILKLREEIGSKVLFGASVHPYDPKFRERAEECVANGAVLMKWLPSAQQIDLAAPKTLEAMKILARIKDGGPLPLLLHVGPEYAIPSSDEKTRSYDYLSWSLLEKARNRLRGSRAWHTPNEEGIMRNIHMALDEGAVIIFAHCGAPYFATGALAKLLEHSDMKVVAELIGENGSRAGRCYGDVSAFCTPFRKNYFDEIAALPPDSLIFGSDFPTPAFELYANEKEVRADFEAVMAGHFERVIIPQDNLLDVNYRELHHAFPGHPMFTNFSRLIQQSGAPVVA